MPNEPFRLVFKRSQTGGKRKPTFSLQVSAEMVPEFERAAQDYGLWKEVIYADPKLDESRELLTNKNLKKDKRRQRRMGAFVSSIDGPAAILLFPMYLMFKITKLVMVLPFKILWWLFKAFRSQDKQIMRFSELKTGKTITTRSLPEIVEAEEIIKTRTNEVTTHVLAALNYSSEAFDATQVA